MAGRANMPLHSAYTDNELRDWLVWSSSANVSSFLRAISEAAMVADLKSYNLLRPALLRLKEDESRSSTSSALP